MKQFCVSQVVVTPMDPDITPDSPGGCSGHDPFLTPGSPVARKRKPRRLREEGLVGVAIMISDTRGFWHADMVRSAEARPFGCKMRHWRPWPRIDQVALGINRRWQERGTWLARVGAVVDCCKQVLSLYSWNTAAWQRQQASSAVLSLPRESPLTRTTSIQTIQKKTNLGQNPQPGLKTKAVPQK